MKNLRSTILPFFFLLVLLSACDNAAENESGTEALTNAETEKKPEAKWIELDLKNFTGVENFSAFDVSLIYGPEHKVEAKPEKKVENLLYYRVKDGVLQLKWKELMMDPPRVKVRVTTPVLNLVGNYGTGDLKSKNEFLKQEKVELNIAGSGDIELKLNADQVDAEIGGSGDIKLFGRANFLIMNVRGSGTLQAKNFPVNSAEVVVNGSGDCQINVSERLKVGLFDSGDVICRGNPEVEQEKFGSGDLEMVN